MSLTRQIVLAGKAYMMFISSLRAAKTKETYSDSLKDYLAYRKLSSPDQLLIEEVKPAQDNIIEYIQSLKERGLSWQTRVIRAAALKHFYEMNDIILNWKKLNRFIGEKSRTVQDRAYTREEISKMLAKCDERKRVMILLLSSSGMRIGGLPELKIKHLTRTKHGLYQIVVYHGTPSQYVTFCTPECGKAIDDYWDFRMRCGEKLSPESLVIREQFPRNDQFRVVKARHLSASTMMNTIKAVLVDAGLKSSAPALEGHRSKRRSEIMQIHGFRKYFDTTCTKAGTHPLYVEMLLGHDIRLKGAYFKPTLEDLLEGNDRMLGYRAAIKSLTIGNEEQLRAENEEIKKQNEDSRHEQQDNLRLSEENRRKEMETLRQEMEKKFQEIIAKIDVSRLS